MKKRIQKCVSLLLALLMVLQMAPIQVFAENANTGTETAGEAAATEMSLPPSDAPLEEDDGYTAAYAAGELFVPDHPEIEREIYGLRTATEKHFQMADGTYTAVQYSYPVHYFEDGIWKDYDNTMSLTAESPSGTMAMAMNNGTSASVQCYETVNGDMTRSFITGQDGTELYSVEKDGSRFAFGLLDAADEAELAALEAGEVWIGSELPVEPETSAEDESVVEPEAPSESESAAEPEMPAEEQGETTDTASDGELTVEPEELFETNEDVLQSEGETAAILETPEESTQMDESEPSETTILSEETEISEEVEENETVLEPAEPAQIFNAELVAMEFSSDDDLTAAMIPEKLGGKIAYENVRPGVSLVYEAFGPNLKESIVLAHALEDYTFEFTLFTDSLTSELTEDGRILLRDLSGTALWECPVPYMYDAAGIMSNDVHYDLVDAGDGKQYLKIVANPEWMNATERVWPVVIDPTLMVSATSSSDTAAISSTYVEQGNPILSHANHQLMYWGWGCATTVQQETGLVHVNNLPPIPESSVLTSATIQFYQYSFSASGVSNAKMGVREITQAKSSGYATYGAWIKSRTWNTKPTISSTYIDYAVLSNSTSGHFASWNITRAAKKWYENGDTNYGLAFDLTNLENYNASIGATATFYSYANTYAPVFIVTYTDTKGIENYYSYQTIGANRAGTAYIGDFTGEVTVIKNDTSVSSSVIPVSVNHVYNSVYSDSQISELNGTGMKFGNGWKLDAVQTVRTQSLSGTTYLIYTDGDGTEHAFSWDSSANAYKDEDGLGLKMTQTASSPPTYKISNDSGETVTFINGIIDNQVDAFGNRIAYRYNTSDSYPSGTSDRLVAIVVWPKGSSTPYTVANFTYDSSGCLTQMSDYSGNTTTYTYDSGGYLVGITHPDGTTVSYTYSGTKIQNLTDNESKYTLRLEFDSSGMLCSWKEYDQYGTGSQTLGASVYVSSRSSRYTKYTTSGRDGVSGNEDDRTTAYLFDFAGHTVNSSTQSADNSIVYGSSAGEYTVSSDRSRKNNRLLRQSSSGRNAVNLLYYGTMEEGGTSSVVPNGWVESVVPSGATAGTSTSVSHSGSKSMFATMPSGTTGATVLQVGEPVLTPNKTYTYSAYVNTQNVSSFSGDGIYLRVMTRASTDSSAAQTNYYSSKLAYQTIDDIGDGWARLSVTFTAENYCHFFVYCAGTAGTVYIDDAQVELGEAPSEISLLRNGDMFASDRAWTNSNSTIASTETAFGNVMMISGGPDKLSMASQTVNVNLPGTETYALSGWGKAVAMPDDPNSTTLKKFGLKATVTYSDGTTEDHYQPFNADVTEWQYTSLMIVPEAPAKTVSTITVRCLYTYNNGWAYFYNLTLTRQMAQCYTYDSNGNLTKVGTTDNRDVNYSYNGSNDLTSFTDRTGVKYDYTYGSYHNVTKITDSVVSMNLTYDAYGNVVQSKLTPAGSTSTSMVTTATYSTDSNSLLASTKNSNGQTTTYTYGSNISKQYGTPTEVVTPDSTKTTTVYNAQNGRATQAYVLGIASLDYGYTNGRLVSIWRAFARGSDVLGQGYNLSYGAFGDLASIAVGTRQLASYTHNARTGDVETMTYGNGTTVQYVYNDLDQVKEVKYNGTTRFIYSYTGDGQLYEVKDASLGLTYTYTYDALGRLIYTGTKGSNGLQIYSGNTYDDASRLSKSVYRAGNFPVRTSTYQYRSTDGQLASATLGDGTQAVYSYDSLGRNSSVAYRQNGSVFFSRNYAYKAPSGSSGGTTTTLVSACSYGDANNNAILSFQYAYDNMGRITSDYSRGYQYDALGQLIRSYDGAGNTVEQYTYDGAGNILTAYKDGTTHNYTYGDANWRDLLTAYDGQAITYDAIGNPTNYLGWAMTWQNGRQLRTASKGNVSATYSYGPDGLRVKKVVNGTTYEYTYLGDKLVRQDFGGKSLEFVYDTDGRPFKVIYRYTSASGNAHEDWYYYMLNPMGDVMALLNNSGSIAAKYSYSAWGKVLSVTDANGNAITSSTHIANANPIRYRGYYYDTESSLYYLQSRYYDPELGRFISADAAEYTTVAAIRLDDTNLFAYCGNNPVNNIDADGELFNTIVGAVVGGILGGISAAVAGESISAGVIGGAVSGGLMGLGADIAIATVATGPVGVVIAVSASFAGGFTGSLACDAINAKGNGKEFSLNKETISKAAFTGLTNTATAVVSAGMNIAMDQPLNTSSNLADIAKSIITSTTPGGIVTAIGIDYAVKTSIISGLTNRIVFNSKNLTVKRMAK